MRDREPQPTAEVELLDFLGDEPDAVQATAEPRPSALSRQLADEDLDTALAAAREIAQAELGSLQDQIVEMFIRRVGEMRHEHIESLLDCVSEVGDGRCVRPMERLLHERWASLSEHQAWRARRIIQHIRRDGRK